MYMQQEFLGYEKYARLMAEEKIVLMMIPADGYMSNQDLRVYVPRLHPVDLGKLLVHYGMKVTCAARGVAVLPNMDWWISWLRSA